MVFQPGVFQGGLFQGSQNGTFAALDAQETGVDTAEVAVVTVPKIWAIVTTTESGSDTAEVTITTFAKSWVEIAALESGSDGATMVLAVRTDAALAVQESGADGLAAHLSARIHASLGGVEQGKDSAEIEAHTLVKIWATLAVSETGQDTASGSIITVVKRWVWIDTAEEGGDTAAFAGSSEGNIIIIARDLDGGIGYLVEMEGWDRVTDSAVTLYFASMGFTTLPTDPVPNQHYLERLQEPGDYRRAMFSTGTTHGQISVGAGYIEIAGNDGALDDLRRRYAFDGYALRIKTIPRLKPRYSDAVTIFAGTVEQLEQSRDKVTVRIRDRLAALDVEHQDVLYAGTTTAGGMNEAEGLPDDLKGKGKELSYGRPPMVPGVAANPFDNIFGLGADGLEAVEDVRDRGVALTPTGTNYTTIAALRAASIPAGQYATALSLGLIRTGSKPAGQLTARPVEKSSPAARTAAQIARRMLLRKGLVEGTDFLARDIAALDLLNPAPIGYWMGPEDQTTLLAIQHVLGSIGASIVPDRLGVFRMQRFNEPSGFPTVTLTEAEMFDIDLLATGDEGRGVPAWRVTVHYGRNWYPMDRDNLDVAATEAFKAFATTEWRTAVAEDASVKAINRLASDLTFETYLTEEADAGAEAARLLALHSVGRDRFQVSVKSFLVDRVELGSVVRLIHRRFGLAAGKDFVVIGIAEDFETSTTTLDLWG